MAKGDAVKIRKIAFALMALAMAAGAVSGCNSAAEPEEVMLSVWCAGEDIASFWQSIFSNSTE